MDAEKQAWPTTDFPSSSHVQATVYVQGGSGDVGSVVLGQKRHGLGDVFRLSGTRNGLRH